MRCHLSPHRSAYLPVPTVCTMCGFIRHVSPFRLRSRRTRRNNGRRWFPISFSGTPLPFFCRNYVTSAPPGSRQTEGRQASKQRAGKQTEGKHAGEKQASEPKARKRARGDRELKAKCKQAKMQARKHKSKKQEKRKRAREQQASRQSANEKEKQEQPVTAASPTTADAPAICPRLFETWHCCCYCCCCPRHDEDREACSMVR